MISKKNTLRTSLLESLENYEVSSYATDLSSMLSACIRTVPFSTVNVIARVTFFSTIGMQALYSGMLRESFNVLSVIHKFASGKISWAEFVRTSLSVEKELNLTEKVCETALSSIKENARYIMKYIDFVPGDIFSEQTSANYFLISENSMEDYAFKK